MAALTVSVVVPMKDEEGSLPLLAEELDGLAAALAGRDAVLDVVLVDDGSEDGTREVVAALSAQRPAWRLLAHATNRGFGAGFRTGAAAARGDVVISYDADCAYPAADVLPLLDALDAGADIASATPFAAAGTVHGGGPLRTLVSRTCSLAYRLALRGRARGVRTFTCAFRAYRAPVLGRLRWESDGFLCAAEILTRALLDGARVTEVPSTLRARVAGASKMRLVRTGWSHLLLLARLLLRPSHAAARAATAHESAV